MTENSLFVHTFHSATAPEHQSWLAFFYEPKTIKGKTYLDRLPMVFAGASEDAVRIAAHEWWSNERAKEDDRRARYAALADARKREKAS